MRALGCQTRMHNESERQEGLGTARARTVGRLTRAELERTRWDPKDGELWVSRMKPLETRVEVRHNTDVQIVCLTCP